MTKVKMTMIPAANTAEPRSKLVVLYQRLGKLNWNQRFLGSMLPCKLEDLWLCQLLALQVGSSLSSHSASTTKPGVSSSTPRTVDRWQMSGLILWIFRALTRSQRWQSVWLLFIWQIIVTFVVEGRVSIAEAGSIAITRMALRNDEDLPTRRYRQGVSFNRVWGYYIPQNDHDKQNDHTCALLRGLASWGHFSPVLSSFDDARDLWYTQIWISISCTACQFKGSYKKLETASNLQANID